MSPSHPLQKFLFFASLLLAVGFVIRFSADLYLISIGQNSAPAWLFLIVRAIVFLVSAAICFVVSVLHKTKSSNGVWVFHAERLIVFLKLQLV